MIGPARHDVERKLAAIFAADVEGYSRLMSLDEVGTFAPLRFTAKRWTGLLPSTAEGPPTRPATAFSLSSPAWSMRSSAQFRCRMSYLRPTRAPLRTTAFGSGSAYM